ncbi:MAG: GNAT family N-acetyltransferase [Merdibacter sp.]
MSGNEQAHAFLPAGFWRSLYPQVKEQLAQAEIYVCEQKGTVCGFIGMRETRIEGLFVDAGCRGQGVGSALLADVKKRRDVLRLRVSSKCAGAGFLSPLWLCSCGGARRSDERGDGICDGMEEEQE